MSASLDAGNTTPLQAVCTRPERSSTARQKLDELAVDIDGMRVEVTGLAKRCVRSEVADSGGEQFLPSNRKPARLGLETTC